MDGKIYCSDIGEVSTHHGSNDTRSSMSSKGIALRLVAIKISLSFAFLLTRYLYHAAASNLAIGASTSNLDLLNHLPNRHHTIIGSKIKLKFWE